MTLEALNQLPPPEAAAALLACCGSRRWAIAMVAARPFADPDAILAKGDAVWAALAPADWLEAFAAHPRIGEGAGRAGRAGRAGEERAEAWSRGEQAGVEDASRARLAALNRDYEARFGYTFIVCATGRSGAEMMAMLERRIGNNPSDELREAAEEQRQITRLRLAKLLT